MQSAPAWRWRTQTPGADSVGSTLWTA